MKFPLFLLKNTPEDVWAVSTKCPDALNRLQTLLIPAYVPSSLPTYRVFIAYTDQLHSFVRQIPALAWELLEYAQEPLEIDYPEKKDTIQQTGDALEVCIRWVKQPKLLAQVKKTGPLWAVSASITLPPSSDQYTTVDCYDKKYRYHRVKTVAIALDGTFSFLR